MFLEQLSNLPGVSGDEGKVRSFIKEKLKGSNMCVTTDTMGNLLVRKKGEQKGPRVMISAHMDEVGLMLVDFEKSGHLRFKTVGSIDTRVLVAKRVRVGPNGIPGVIGAKPIHLQKPKERKKPYEIDHLYIDIGAENKEEARKLVTLGDYVSFDTACITMGENLYRGKAFDDRAGCSALLELLLDPGTPSFDGAFTVQEEVGCRGAAAAAYTLRPDLALILEGTAAADTPGTDKESSSTVLGQGPAISIMDRSVIVDRSILHSLVKAASSASLPFQFRRFTGGFTDAGAVALTREGVKAGVISIPCRYIHSPCSVLQESDLRNTAALVKVWLRGDKRAL